MDGTSGAAEPRPVGWVRAFGLLEATSLVVGSVIGSGIFLAPSIGAGYRHRAAPVSPTVF
jgi:amino acid transporter